MKIGRIAVILCFSISLIGLSTSQTTGSVSSGQTTEFSVDGQTHNLSLDFIDGGARVILDDVESRYDSFEAGEKLGFKEGDKFTVNRVTVEITAVVTNDGSDGSIRFEAYPEEDIKRLETKKEMQINLNGENHRVFLNYIDGGVALALNDQNTVLGSELQENERIYSDDVAVEIVNIGIPDDGEAFVEFEIMNAEGVPEGSESGLGRLSSKCNVEPQGSEVVVDYSFDMPEFTNYRDLTVEAQAVKNGSSYFLTEQSRELPEGKSTFTESVSIPTPVDSSISQVYLDVKNDAGEGNMIVDCGELEPEDTSGSEDETESDVFTDVEINYEAENQEYSFSTNAESENGIEIIEWDLNGDNQYERNGRRVEKNFESTGERTVTMRISDREENLRETTEMIEIEGESNQEDDKERQDENEEDSENPDKGENDLVDSEPTIDVSPEVSEVGNLIEGEAYLPEKHASNGYTIEVEGPSGKVIWEEGYSEKNAKFNIESDESWKIGKYSVYIVPRGQGVIGSILNVITGSDALAEEDFRLEPVKERWRIYCENNDYNSERIEDQVSCIEQEIVPRYFEAPVPSDTVTAESLCRNLLGYRYSKEQKGCVAE